MPVPHDQYVAVVLALVARLVHEARITDDELSVHPVASVLADLDPAFALGHVHTQVRRLDEVAVVGVRGDACLRVLASEEDLKSRCIDIHEEFVRAGEYFDVALLPNASILEHERAPVGPVRHSLVPGSLGPDAVPPHQHRPWILHGERKFPLDNIRVFLHRLEPFVLAIVHIRECDRGQSLHKAPGPLHTLTRVHLHKLLAPTKPREALEYARCLVAEHVQKRRLHLGTESDLLRRARQRRHLGKLGTSRGLRLKRCGHRRLACPFGVGLGPLPLPPGKVVSRTVPEHVLWIPRDLVLPVRQHIPELATGPEDDRTNRAALAAPCRVGTPSRVHRPIPTGDGRAARQALCEPSHSLLSLQE
mmetsp:Transcript_1624/g.5397  ORF Transcript_1624/g.5397 Transcript_1624/m.5397 type:complete len:362 (-) Transcript_1624:2274-3359(-)